MEKLRLYKFHVPAHPEDAERCPPRRRRGPRSLTALIRRAAYRFSRPAGALAKPLPHHSGAPAGVSVTSRLMRSSDSASSKVNGSESISVSANEFHHNRFLDFSQNSKLQVQAPSNITGGWATSRAAAGFRRLVDSTAVSSPCGIGEGTVGENVCHGSSESKAPPPPPPSRPQQGACIASSNIFANQRIRIWSVNARKLLRRRAEI